MKKIIIGIVIMLFAVAAIATAATYVPKIYKKSGGDELVVASGGTITVESGGALVLGATPLTMNGASIQGITSTVAELNLNDDLPASFTFAYASTGGSNVCEVSIQAKDAAGVAMTRACIVLIYLSDANTGVGVTGTTASGAVTAKANSGTDMGAITAKKVLLAQTKADGTFVLSITDTSKTGFYVCVVPLRGGTPSVSAALTGHYGA